MKLKIALLEGDGIGPEVIAQAVKCLQAVEETFNHQFSYESGLIGVIAIEKTNNPLPKATLDLCKKSDAILFGAIGSPKYNNNSNAEIRPEQGLLTLRKELQLFSNIRPVKTFPTLIHKSPLKEEIIANTDFVIYRELTGGLYFGEKKISNNGSVASDLCVYSEKEINRIAHLAFKAAKNRNKKLTLVDKAIVLESSKLWRKVVSRVGESYPEVTLNFLFVDNAAMQIIINPSQFDVILTESLFGDILAHEASVISGSIGLLPSSSIGSEHAMFGPVHGSYSKAKGKDVANPIAAILSAAMLLDHFGLLQESKAVVSAVTKSLKKKFVTPDLKENSKYGSSHVGDFIAGNIVDSTDILNINDENIGIGKSTII